MAECRDRLHAQVLFSIPAELSADWDRAILRDVAEEIPGLEVRNDPNQREAKLFAARTSGVVLLYSANGELLYHGGITSGRGHSGDSGGHDSLVSWVRQGQSQTNRACVYGCQLGQNNKDSNDD